MVPVKGTNARKNEAIQKAEKEGRQLAPEELNEFETESILKMQQKAELAKKTAIGNAFLANRNIPSVKIQECKF